MVYHILLVTNVSPALQYGVGTYITQILKGFTMESNFIVSVVELDCDNIDGFLYMDDNGYDQYLIPSWRRYVAENNKKMFYDEAAHWLASNLDSKRQVIFHFNTPQDEELITSLRSILTLSKMITTVHYFDWTIALLGNKWRFHRMLLSKGADNHLEHILYTTYIKENRFYHCMDRIICLTNASKSILNKDYNLPSDSLVVIPNGMEDYSSLNLANDKNTIVPQGTSPILLYVGRLDRSKGLSELIQAFRGILNIYPKAQLLIVGDGNFSFCLKECFGIWGHITFTGKVAGDTLYHFYSQADLGIIPSYSEQCSYVAIEMMMHGLPFVGTDCDGLKEMLPASYRVPIHTENESVYIDSKELAAILLHKLAEPKNGQVFRCLYEKQYRLERMLEKLKKEYEHLW